MQSSTPAPAPPAGAAPTRLLITNLHPSVASHHLREHLQACPPAAPGVTDVKVLSRPNGSSRCIAFAGFKSHDDADRVRRWASGAWVAGDRGGARIKVDWAKDTRDAPRPAKRLKTASTSTTENTGPKQDDRFAEFMAVMAPARTYTDAAAAPPSQAAAAAAEPVAESSQRLATTTRGDAGISEPSAPSRAPPQGAAVPEATEVQVDGAAEDETLTDADYLARRMKRRFEDVDEAGEPAARDMLWLQEDGEEASTPAEQVQHGATTVAHKVIATSPPVSAGQDAQARETILETGRLFLRNLPFTATREDLYHVFGAYGSVEQVHIPVDSRTGASKGLAYVSFANSADAVAAHDALDGTTFQGRLLHILPAIGRSSKSSADGRPSTLKEDRLERRKQSAGQAFSWGSLFLNTDAALTAVAERLGVAKSALLDPSASDPAVKVALAEAHTLAETKRYFEDANINVAAFSQPGARSSTCILVKNLPFATTASALQALFSPYGVVRRLLIPPSGLIAIVEMEDASAAAAAWRALVYKQFGGSVLYLEKAPAAIFVVDDDLQATSRSSASPSVPLNKGSTAAGDATSLKDDAGPAAATLFVKNLSFATTTPRLRAAFDQLPDVVFARVQTKPDPVQVGRTLSMGFGFVGFRTAAAAASAKDARQGYVLDGHALEIRFAQRNSDKPAADDAAARSRETSTKLLVKNVPTYGQLKSVRLPRKMDNKTRGFAFLEFATRRDAEAAFNALEHTHLLGRHLVLQWAGADDGEAKEGEHAMDALVEGKSRREAKTKFAM
ncbi:Multiple RNA-binding domain-containing protein 1 [Rhodotorula kratochvilovae]